MVHSTLQQRRILLAVTGGIAAYKSAELCRLLKKAGAEVRVVMTQGAQAFVTPLTFQALSGHPVHTELLDESAEQGMGHIELAKWPELILIAPASADLIARYSQGLANDLLSTLLLATRAPVAMAPAMNQAMWLHPLTQRNVQQLQAYVAGLMLWGPDSGQQACGDVGPGRMLEPVQLFENCVQLFAPKVLPFSGFRVVITAGPTREAIDPVRYISNYSSGKMGYALAQAFAEMGAEVTLISGPVQLMTPPQVLRVDVNSAQEMFDASHAAVKQGCDIFVAAAAVADYRPANVANQKIKKQDTGDAPSIALTRNDDIVASIAALPDKPFTVGFAAETQDVLAYAQDKLKRKKLDLIVANDVSRPDVGFNSDFNEVYIVAPDKVVKLDKTTKTTLAGQILAQIAQAMPCGRHKPTTLP